MNGIENLTATVEIVRDDARKPIELRVGDANYALDTLNPYQIDELTDTVRAHALAIRKLASCYEDLQRSLSNLAKNSEHGYACSPDSVIFDANQIAKYAAAIQTTEQAVVSAARLVGLI